MTESFNFVFKGSDKTGEASFSMTPVIAPSLPCPVQQQYPQRCLC